MSKARVAILAPFASTPAEANSAGASAGGVERYVVELAKGISELGYRPTLVAPSGATEHVRGHSVEVISFPRWKVLYGAPIFNPLRHLKSIAGFDIVHAQATYPLFSDTNPLFCKMRRIPSVVTYHFSPSPTSPVGMALGKLYLSTLARMISLHDRVIFSTSSYREHSPLLRRVPPNKVRVIPMGVDTDRFQVDPSVATEKRFLFVGRLVPYKDLPLLLKAMSIVNVDLPDHELCIVGSGPLEAELRRLAERLGVNAKFLGKITDERLLALYQSSAATVLSSHDPQEAFGMVLAESMSCGTPVIAADIPGVREVARVGGDVVEPGSARALARAMVDAAGKRLTAAEKMKLHERMEELFSWRSVARRTAAVYEELLRAG